MPGSWFRRRDSHRSPTGDDRTWMPPPPAGADLTSPQTRPPATADTDGPVMVLADGRLASLAPGSDHRVGRAQVDICFVFDTTGSMANKIAGLVGCMTRLVADLDATGLDWRVTTVPFGDLTVPGDRIEDRLGFVTTCAAAQAQLRSMPRFSGGGNQGESSIEAMLVGLGRRWRPGAVKVVVLLTDEAALVSEGLGPETVSEGLRHHDAVCFVASPDLGYFRRWAEQNGGRWLPIAASMDTTTLLRLLRALVGEVATVAGDVHRLAGGSVRRYRELTAGAGGAT